MSMVRFMMVVQALLLEPVLLVVGALWLKRAVVKIRDEAYMENLNKQKGERVQ